LSASSVVAALPLPPPSPAASGRSFSPDGFLRRRKCFAASRKKVRGAEGEVFCKSVGRLQESLQVKLHAISGALKNKLVKDIHRLHDGFKFMEAVAAACRGRLAAG
jgi:hypothetical protein